MNAPSAVLAIDAGQTGMKVRVTGAGAVRDEVFPGIRTHEPLLPQLAAVARAMINTTGTPVPTVTAGVSGLTAREADATALLALLREVGVTTTVLAHDSTTSFLGAMGDARGAVVAAGTGVVTLAVGRSRVARVDGWGNLIGDAGSGYWIGRAALEAVMRAHDGRGPATALSAIAEATWPDLTAAYISLQSDDDRVSIVASFAVHVAQLAEAGDSVARAITDAAAEELACSVDTALHQVRTAADEPLAVCAIGGVFRSALLRDAFDVRLRARGGEVTLIAPRGHGIDGASALAFLPATHPLAHSLSTAHADSLASQGSL